MEDMITKLVTYIACELLRQPQRVILPDQAIISLGGHPKPASCGQLKTGQ
jgi:hypothetical protein